eukprot:GAHX01002396.1.p1 GENE.GAHX01002396.1~~GAHX01002396.1.p1  ORF type:complete len:404 (+),score=98.74 GAHX01002396.1:98-1309(+)
MHISGIFRIYFLLLFDFALPSSKEFFRDTKFYYHYIISKSNNLSIFFVKFTTDIDMPSKVVLHTLLLFKSKGVQFTSTVEGQQIINLVQIINLTKKKNTKLNMAAAPMAIKLSRSKDRIILFDQTMSAVLNFIEYGTLIEIFFKDNTYQKITHIEYAINSGGTKRIIHDPVDPKSILIENINDLFKIHRKKVNKFEIDTDEKNINFVDNTFFSTTVNDISVINSRNDKNSKNNSVLEEINTLKNDILSPPNDKNANKIGLGESPPNSILKKGVPKIDTANNRWKKNLKFAKEEYNTGNNLNKKDTKDLKSPIKIKKKCNKESKRIKVENNEKDEEIEKKEQTVEEIESNTSVLGFALISVLIGLESVAVIVLLIYMRVSKISVEMDENKNNVDMVLEQFEYRK